MVAASGETPAAEKPESGPLGARRDDCKGGAPSRSAAHRSHRVYIALGSNLGDRRQHILAALHELEDARDIRVIRCSSLHETDPVGGPLGQGRFLNAVAELETTLSPRELLARLLATERRHGRKRGVANGPRTLDLDLLLYGDRVINEPHLTVPHPRMWERRFVMEPLTELCDVRALQARPAAQQTNHRT